MPFPSAGPTTLTLVKDNLHIADNVDDATITLCVDAINARARQWRVAQAANQEVAPADWAAWPHIIRGCTLLASTLFRRSSSPDGVAAGSVTPVWVIRNDPDAAMLLQLGPYAKPSVG